jgi:hypothetical protein
LDTPLLLDGQRLIHLEQASERTAVELDTHVNLADLGLGHSHGGPTERASGEPRTSRVQDGTLLPYQTNLSRTASIVPIALEAAPISTFDQ